MKKSIFKENVDGFFRGIIFMAISFLVIIVLDPLVYEFLTFAKAMAIHGHTNDYFYAAAILLAAFYFRYIYGSFISISLDIFNLLKDTHRVAKLTSLINKDEKQEKVDWVYEYIRNEYNLGEAYINRIKKLDGVKITPSKDSDSRYIENLMGSLIASMPTLIFEFILRDEGNFDTITTSGGICSKIVSDDIFDGNIKPVVGFNLQIITLKGYVDADLNERYRYLAVYYPFDKETKAVTDGYLKKISDISKGDLDCTRMMLL